MSTADLVRQRRRGAGGRDDRRARREMGERVEAAGIAHPRLTPLHDGIGLGVQRYALAGAISGFTDFWARTRSSTCRR